MAIHIDEQVCKGCGLCLFYCPKDVLRLSEHMNVRGYRAAEVYQAENCIQCRLCEFGCPDLAIFIEKSEVAREVFKDTEYA